MKKEKNIILKKNMDVTRKFSELIKNNEKKKSLNVISKIENGETL